MKNKQISSLMTELQQYGKCLKSKSKNVTSTQSDQLLRKVVQFTKLPITPAYLLMVYFSNDPRGGKGLPLAKVLGKMAEKYKAHMVEQSLEYLLMRDWAEVRTSFEDEITETLLISSSVECAFEEMDGSHLPSLEIIESQCDLRLLMCKATTLRRNPLNSHHWSSYVLQLVSEKKVPFVKHMDTLGLSPTDQSMALLITGLYINDHMGVNLTPVINTLNSSRITALKEKREMESGKHPVIQQAIIESASCFLGESAFKPTDAFLSVCLSDQYYQQPPMLYTSCTRIKSTDIKSKKLIYDQPTESFIRGIQSILNSDYYDREKSTRIASDTIAGFNVIISGAPGTGKTELVRQLARESGRDIIDVDITGVRDKYYGETEKLLKRVFDEYQKDCAQSTRKPILLFNEADSIFGRRQENMSGSTSKIENTIQTILLNQLERHEGILIVTTNLPDSMDMAYARRFMFEVDVLMPDEEVRYQHLLHAFPGGINEEVAKLMARQFPFSPAILENFKAQQAMFKEVLKQERNLEEHLREFLTKALEGNNRQIGFSSN